MGLFDNYEPIKSAVISQCGKYRYQLSRIWDSSKPIVLFIMLNPSTADAEQDDPTIRRCIGFARSWGYGGLMVGNLSAYRATNPTELKSMEIDYYANDQNSQSVMSMYFETEITVFAWGNPPCELPLCPLIGLENTHYLELTASGNPKHPLYLKGNLKPIKYKQQKYFG